MKLQIQQDIEDKMYEFLKSIDMQNKLADFGNASPEDIAKEMLEGAKTTWLGDFIKKLDNYGKVPEFEFMCESAFLAAMIRIAKERPISQI